MAAGGAAGAAGVSAAAAQEDDDQNDPQAAAIITVVPHISFTSLSGLSHTMFETAKSSLTEKNFAEPYHREGGDAP